MKILSEERFFRQILTNGKIRVIMNPPHNRISMPAHGKILVKKCFLSFRRTMCRIDCVAAMREVHFSVRPLLGRTFFV